MRFIYLISVLVTLFFTTSCAQNAQEAKESASADKGNRIEVLDFYGTHRCVTCKSIEANAKYTVENLYPEASKSGKIVFKTINVDEEANYDMAEKYEAVGTALFLNVIKNGKEKHVNLTDFAFLNGMDKEAFTKGLKEKIDAELKGL